MHYVMQIKRPFRRKYYLESFHSGTVYTTRDLKDARIFSNRGKAALVKMEIDAESLLPYGSMHILSTKEAYDAGRRTIWGKLSQAVDTCRNKFGI